jgi:5-methylcytosine-specific restriction endonuclease McrA
MANEYVSAELRRAVTQRALACCEYCRSQARYAPQAFSVEHVRPRSKGGETALNNLALACQGCNNRKYTKTTGYDAANQRSVALYHPRQHLWHEHFAWNEDFTLIVGLTTTGRATVETLQLNREGLVNLRRVLVALGEHPPQESQ